MVLAVNASVVGHKNARNGSMSVDTDQIYLNAKVSQQFTFSFSSSLPAYNYF